MDENGSGKTIARPDVQAGKQDSQPTRVREQDGDASTLVRSHPDAIPTVVPAGAPGSDEGPVTPEAPGRYDLRGEYARGSPSASELNGLCANQSIN